MRPTDRRRFIQGSAASALLLASGEARLRAATAHGMAPARATPDFKPDLELELNAGPDEISVLPGDTTRVWRYTGRVLRGKPQALDAIDGSGHIPIIRVRRGQKIRIHFSNQLPEESIVHWHGLHVPQRMDGHPMYAIATGQTYVYEFVVDNRAGTYWFHPHPHGRTGHQVYHGLTGLIVVSDDEEDAARLPGDDLDLPLVIQDRSFDAGNQLVYLAAGMHDRMMGFIGRQVLVNGSIDYQRTVPRTAHRLRLFNGSNATTYRLRLGNGKPFTVIGTDGGLLERPLMRETLTLGPAERADVWVDFASHAPGEEIALEAESWSPMLANVTNMQAGTPAQRGARVIARFRIGSGGARLTRLPQRLAAYPVLRIEDAVNRSNPRSFQMSMRGGRALLNGREFKRMDEVADNEKVRLGTTEVWEFANDANFGMRMAHPMHVHNLQFRVVGRNGASHALSAGFTDEGLKDVVLVLPGERVRVLMKFENHTGIYLYHCHILEHEDLGMMRNYLVEA